MGDPISVCSTGDLLVALVEELPWRGVDGLLEFSELGELGLDRSGHEAFHGTLGAKNIVAREEEAIARLLFPRKHAVVTGAEKRRRNVGDSPMSKTAGEKSHCGALPSDGRVWAG